MQMVADLRDGFVVRGVWDAPRFRVSLRNGSATAIRDFRLGISGPMRITPGSAVEGGRVVAQLSNYAEIEPPEGFILEAGAEWTLEIAALDFPLRHFTDGIAGSFVILRDGLTVSAVTMPTACHGSTAQPQRGTMRLEGPGSTPFSMLPWPNRVELSGRRTAPPGLAVDPGTPSGEAFKLLTDQLFPGEALVRPEHSGGLPVTLLEAPELGTEACRISFSPDGVEVRASDRRGYLHGLVTLGQLVRGARLEPRKFSFPLSGAIEDGPAMPFRGCHLDVARRFYAPGEIQRFLAILAWNKLNRFHWHLSDDEGWRVEIDAYPELTAIGAWRGHGLAIPPLLGSGPERDGGYYTKADIQHVVALADSYGIEVIPEIDVPGHCYAMLASLPALRDADETGTYESIQSFPNNCLNPAVEAVYGALDAIFAEMFELFPSRYFHVGADEVPAGAWRDSPLAQGHDRQGAAALQAGFLQRIQALVSAHGKITGAWEEAAQGGGIDRASCYLVGWHTVEANQKLATEGYDVVVSPGQSYYLDMANGPGFEEPGAGWAGWASPEKTYAFDPTDGWSAAEKAHFMGVQASIWSEPMLDRGVFDRLVFPRLSAVAETGWTEPRDKDFGRFADTVELMPNLYGQLASR